MGYSAAFIGLGSMGQPMATNLLKNNVNLFIYNRTKDKMSSLLKIGAISLDYATELDNVNGDNLDINSVPMDCIFPDIEHVTIEQNQIISVMHGNSFPSEGLDNCDIMLFSNAGECFGIGSRQSNLIQPRRIL